MQKKVNNRTSSQVRGYLMSLNGMKVPCQKQQVLRKLGPALEMAWQICLQSHKKLATWVRNLSNQRAPELTLLAGNTSGSKLLQTISSLISPNAGWSDPITDAEAQEQQHGNDQASKVLLSEQLATSTVVDQLIDIYFQLYHSSYPILHESTFREKCRDRTSGPLKTSFQITFYMVLAIGHWLSAPEREHARAPYYSAARSMFTIRLLEAGTLGTVQALLLMVRSICQFIPPQDTN